MMIVLLLAAFMVAIIAYGVWMAGQLGIGPGLGRSRRRSVRAADSDTYPGPSAGRDAS